MGTRSHLRLTAWPIILANLVPLFGALFWGWDAAEIAFQYWAETVVIGLFQIPRILFTPQFVNEELLEITPADERNKLISAWEPSSWPMRLFLRLFLAGFFTVHYGFFVAIQGMLLFAFLLNGYEDGILQSGNLIEISRFFLTKSHVQLGISTIGIGHLMYYFQKSLLERAYEKGAVLLEFIGPYKRIIIQQFLVIMGAPLVLASGGPIGALALLVVLKGGFDLLAYRQKDPWFWLRSSKEPIS